MTAAGERKRACLRERATLPIACTFLLAAAAACRGGGVARPQRHDGEGRAVVIHAARSGGEPGRAHVDERRWREVPARGEVELGPVAAQLELDSVVIESVSDPGGLRARSCHVVSADAGLREPAWLWGRTVSVTLEGGDRVDGEVVEVGEPMAVIDDGDVRTAVELEALHLDRDADDEVVREGGVPRVGDDVFALDGDGEEVFGTFSAVRPDRLVVRAAGGRRRVLDVDAIVRLTVTGVPAQPSLRCSVESARPGRHLVRVAYATPGFGWRAGYQVLLDGDDGPLEAVTLTSTFEIDAAGLPVAGPARVRLVFGTPAEPEAPVTVWEGDATIGGGLVQVHAAPVSRRARLDLVYRGALGGDDDDPRYPTWHEASGRAVWRELAIERLPADAPGPLRVGVRGDREVRWVDGELLPSPATAPLRVVRVALAPEPDLVGFRRKVGRDPDGTVLIDDVAFSVANRGAVVRTVLIEEEVRSVARPAVLFARVGEGGGDDGELLHDRWRTTAVIPAGALVQGQVVLQYRFKRY